MSKPLPILEALRHLSETTAEVEKLRFFVDTAEGLRLLPLSELLKLYPTPAEQVVVERVVTETAAQDPRIAELVEQFHAQQEQIELLADTLGDVSLFDLEQSVAKSAAAFEPEESVALGYDALKDGAKDRENVAVGLCAGVNLEGTGNTLIGPYAGFECEGELSDVTAIGYRAMSGVAKDTVNVTAVGAYAHNTGSDQVVLGDHRATLQTLNAGHRRSDLRDMHQPVPCELGLDFVLRVQPLQYQNDFRDAYIDWASKPSEPEKPREEPEPPTLSESDPEYQPALIAYLSERAVIRREREAYRIAMSQYHTDLTQWLEDNSLGRLNSDGTHRGERLHLGFDAGQLLDECERLGMNMALAQDHAVHGGQAAKSHSDSELLAVLWRAVQQLTAELRSQDTVDRIASALVQRHSTALEAAQAIAPAEPVLPAEE